MIFECSDRREARELAARLRTFVDDRALGFVVRVKRERPAVVLECAPVSAGDLREASEATRREVERGEIFASRWAGLGANVGASGPGAIEPALVLAALASPVAGAGGSS